MPTLKRRTLLLTGWALAIVLGTAWYAFGPRVARVVAQYRETLRLRDSDDPVVRALARGEIGPGTSVEELIEKYPPKKVRQYGRFVDVRYDRPDLIAMDGKLVFAKFGSCSQAHIFFDRLTEADERAYSASVTTYYDQQFQEWKAAHSAAGGVMGWASCFTPLRELANPPPTEEERMLAEQIDPHNAVVGVAGYLPWCSPYREVGYPPPVEPNDK